VFQALQPSPHGMLAFLVASARMAPDGELEGWLVYWTTSRGLEVRISMSASWTGSEDKYVNMLAHAPVEPITRARKRAER
jgi:hypothetical protein